MPVLEGFVLVSQLTSVSGDGSSPNAQMDCVPSCLCAGAMYLNGIKEMNKQYNPDAFLDLAYPEGYQGGTDAHQYVEPLKKLGIHLYPMQSNPANLVAIIHQHLAQGHPVVVTVPDVYVPASYGWTHVLCAYEDEPGYITMLDPYIGKGLKKSDAEWTNLVLFNEIWILEKEETPAMQVPKGWHDDGTTLVDPQGKKVLGGFRDYVLAHEWNPDDLVVLEERQMGSLEDSNPSLGAGAQIIFRFTMLAAPAKGGGIIREYVGVELVTQRNNVAKYYQRWQDALKAAQAPADLQQRLDAAVARLSSIGIDLSHVQEEVKQPL